MYFAVSAEIIRYENAFGCEQMAEFIDQTRQLQYEEAPNYDRLQALLQSLPACSKGGRRSTGKGTSGRTSSSSSAVSSSTSTSSGARQSLLAGDNKGAAAEKKETAAQKKAAAVFADTTKKQVVPAARSTRGRSVHEEEEEEIPSANVKKPRVAGTAKTVSRPAAAVAKSVSKPARGSEGARARAKAEEVITISSDEEESQEEDTPVKAKKPQPAAPSTTSGTKRTRGGTRVSGSTRASQHVPEPLEEDSDEGEARGNTPVKAKKSAAPPPTAVRSPAPALQPPSPLVRASSKARAAPSPLLHRDTTVPIPLQAATGERRGDKKDGGGAQKLYLQVKTSDCAAYVDRMWPVGGMGGAGGVQVVGSDAEKAGIRDITLEDDHFLSARLVIHAHTHLRCLLRITYNTSHHMHPLPTFLPFSDSYGTNCFNYVGDWCLFCEQARYVASECSAEAENVCVHGPGGQQEQDFRGGGSGDQCPAEGPALHEWHAGQWRGHLSRQVRHRPASGVVFPCRPYLRHDISISATP